MSIKDNAQSKTKFFTWSDIESYLERMASTLKIVGNDLTGIYGVPRGGLILAVILSHKLKLPLIQNIDDISQNTLVVDDIVETGETIRRLNKKVRPAVRNKLKLASLHYVENSIVQSDKMLFSCEKLKVKTEWFIYPWEALNYKKDNTL